MSGQVGDYLIQNYWMGKCCTTERISLDERSGEHPERGHTRN